MLFKNMKIYLNTPLGKRMIGDYDPKKKLFFKEVKKSKDLFRKLNAWAIDSKFFNDVLLPQNINIHIHEKERGFDYKITAKEFNTHCHYLHFVGQLAQVFCPIHYFTITDKEGRVRDAFEDEPEKKKEMIDWQDNYNKAQKERAEREKEEKEKERSAISNTLF